MKIISLYGGRDGIGKTLICKELGIKLSEMGKKVLLIDSDLEFADLSSSFKINYNKSIFDLKNYLRKTKLENMDNSIKKSFLKELSNNLFILPMIFNEKEIDFNEEDMINILNFCKSFDFEYMIIDTTINFKNYNNPILVNSDVVYLVTLPEFYSLDDSNYMLNVLKEKNIPTKNFKLIFNKYKNEKKEKDMLFETSEFLKLPVSYIFCYHKNLINLEKEIFEFSLFNLY